MKNLNKILITALISFIVLSGTAFSQQGTTIKGVVVDKASGSPMESAAIQVFNSSDSSLTGGSLSDNKGEFTVTDIPKGTYNIRVSYIGYSSAVARNLKIDEKKEINLGTVRLEPSSEMTEEIEVVGEAPIMTIEAGKKIYDVKKDLTAKSGNVLDMLKNIPSIQVDNDGNVSLRGSGNVKILIDGKPSAMLSNGTQILQNIPANMVEKVEVINNPSAKYEAEGVSGIINLVMNQDTKQTGYSGNLKVNGGTEDKYNISGSGTTKLGKFGITGSYSYWNYSMPGRSSIDRTNYLSTTTPSIGQEMLWRYKGKSHYASFGADYEINKFNTLSLVANYFNYDRDISNNNTLYFYDVSNNLTSSIVTNVQDMRIGNNVDLTLTYNLKFENKEQDFTTFVNYSRRNEESPNDFKIYGVSSQPELEKKYSDYLFNFMNFQADYVHPFSEDLKIETGLKSNMRLIDGNYTFDYFDYNTNSWMPYSNRYNDADYTDVISAFYATVSGKYKDFSYQAGVRGEHTYLDFSIMSNSEQFNRDYIDLFPSFSLSQKIGQMNQVQLSYSRRINRPNLFLLNPFVDYFDEFTRRSGNPYLNPEYFHTAELGYTRYLPFGSVTLQGYFRNTNDDINFIAYVDTNGVSYSRPENRGTARTFGGELVIQGGFAKWWTFNTSANYYNTNLFNDDGVNNFDKDFNAWTVRFNTNAAIPDIFDVQLTYFYNGRQETSQGFIEPFQMMNLVLQKALFDKKIVLAMRINDLLNQQKFRLMSSDPTFKQTIFQKVNSRAVFLTLTYNFGENGVTKSQRTVLRKQRETEMEIQQSGN